MIYDAAAFSQLNAIPVNRIPVAGYASRVDRLAQAINVSYDGRRPPPLTVQLDEVVVHRFEDFSAI